MVTFRSFKAVRPANRELAEEIASLPYDVLNSTEARKLVENNPKSFLHIVKPEIDLPPETDLYDNIVYTKAKDNFNNFRKEGWLIQEDKPHYYIYRQTMEERSQYGLVGCVSGDDYWADKIKKHEHTRKAKEKDRIRHVDTVNANAGPVFLFYPRNALIDEIVKKLITKKPLFDFCSLDTTPSVQHTVWTIPLESNQEISKLFEVIPHIYVADGHHRTATGAIIAKRRTEENANHTGEEEYNFFLAVLFPAEDLHILDYNRVVKNLNGNSTKEFLQKVAGKFDITENHKIRKAPQKGTFGMYLEKKWYLLTAKSGSYDPEDIIKSLDVAILNDNLLSPILGIADLRTDKRIDFVGGIRGMDELERRVNSSEMKVAFSMFPTSIQELMKVADTNLQMPPKSTWFEPKLRSGLLIHIYNENQVE